MTGAEALASVTTINTQQVQSFGNALFWTGSGMLVGVIILFAIWKLYTRTTYRYNVTVVEKLGKGEIQYETWAKEFQDDAGNYMLDYLGIGQSQVWAEFSSYLRTIKKTFLIFPQSFKGFTVYKLGKKIIPIKVTDKEITPIDYDMFNYMQWKIRAIIAKYKKIDEFKQLLPYIALGMVVMAFIMGSLFWGKHVENVAGMIINAGKEQAQLIVDRAGLQVLTPK